MSRDINLSFLCVELSVLEWKCFLGNEYVAAASPPLVTPLRRSTGTQLSLVRRVHYASIRCPVSKIQRVREAVRKHVLQACLTKRMCCCRTVTVSSM